MHHLHGILRLSDFVVCARQLIENLIVALVLRIRLEQFVVSPDGLLRPGLRQCFDAIWKLQLITRGVGNGLMPHGRALLEIAVRLGLFRFADSNDTGRQRLVAASARPERRFRCRQLVWRIGPDEPVRFFDLQVCHTPHGFGGHSAFRSFLEKPLVALCGHLQAILQRHFLDLGLNMPQVGQCYPVGVTRAGNHTQWHDENSEAVPVHCCSAPLA